MAVTSPLQRKAKREPILNRKKKFKHFPDHRIRIIATVNNCIDVPTLLPRTAETGQHYFLYFIPVKKSKRAVLMAGLGEGLDVIQIGLKRYLASGTDYIAGIPTGDVQTCFRHFTELIRGPLDK